MSLEPGSAFLKHAKQFTSVVRLDLGVLTIMHLLVDLHSGMLPVLLLYQRQALNLSLTQIGIIAGVYNFGLSLCQPIFGHLADRFGERRFAFGGAIWIALLGAGLGFTSSFASLLVLVTLAGLGSSAFHPAAASGVSRISSSGRGSGMSFFLVGGSIGYALGPLAAVGIFETLGLHGTAWIAVVALSLAALLIVLLQPLWPISIPDHGQLVSAHQPAALKGRLPAALIGTMIALIILSGARAWIYQGLSNFVPLQMTALGFPRVEATRWLSVMLLFNSAGVLIGGHLTDRFGPRAVMTASLTLLVPVLVFASRVGAAGIGPLASISGLLVGLPVAAAIIVGQSFLPRGSGLASGLVLGISFTIGAIGIAVTGVVADHWGLSMAMLTFGLLACMAAIAGLAMPKTISTPKPDKEITSVPWME